jgi:uncharacterized protein (TIGR02453 family)
MKEFNIDHAAFPPFEGFPIEGIRFLEKLKRNNNREWFKQHKSEYDKFVKLPMQSFIAALRHRMETIIPEIDINPAKNIFRIYRDTRFGNDKTPYKTNVAAVFHLRGYWQDSAGYYIHIEPGTIYVGGGIYMPTSAQLKLVRSAISECKNEFSTIVENKKFKARFGTLEGNKLQRAPLGYSPDHPMIEWLKYKSYYTGLEWNEKECRTADFVIKVANVYGDLRDLIRFLNRALNKI